MIVSRTLGQGWILIKNRTDTENLIDVTRELLCVVQVTSEIISFHSIHNTIQNTFIIHLIHVRCYLLLLFFFLFHSQCSWCIVQGTRPKSFLEKDLRDPFESKMMQSHQHRLISGANAWHFPIEGSPRPVKNQLPRSVEIVTKATGATTHRGPALVLLTSSNLTISKYLDTFFQVRILQEWVDINCWQLFSSVRASWIIWQINTTEFSIEPNICLRN